MDAVEILLYLISLLVVAGWVFWILTLIFAYFFFVTESHPQTGYQSPASILIPVKGLDYGAYDNFASFCRQNYPEYELLIGFFDPLDPARAVAEKLQNDLAFSNVRIFVAQPPGLNRKAAMLHFLAGQASHPLIVAVDSDMRASPEYLSAVVAPLSDPRVGLVTCTYRGVEPLSLTAKLESLHMGASFLPLVIVARKFLSMRFAMGATLALRRVDLEQMGGFAVVTDFLADDYQIGERIANLGFRVHLSRYVINCALGKTSFWEFWERQIRFARTNRVCRPLEYPGQIIYFSTPLALVLVVSSQFTPLAVDALIISLLLRWWVAWSISGWTGNAEMRRWLVFLPIQDSVSALVWVAGLFGSHVVWRGQRVRVLEDGRIALPGYYAAQAQEGDD